VEIERKLRVTGAYLDILIARRIWNWHAIDYSTMQYAMFLVMRDIRRKSATAVAELLRGKLEAEKETFASKTASICTGKMAAKSTASWPASPITWKPNPAYLHTIRSTRHV
jgi:hypothetical protein